MPERRPTQSPAPARRRSIRRLPTCSRIPTVAVLEERVASLEGGRAALAAASGHAAQFLIFFTLMEPGDEFIASRNLYGGSLTQFGLSFKKLGWKCRFVDPS